MLACENRPLRYRGYVYDVETNLYYLQSRYYDPYTGRFLNADILISTGQGLTDTNMFAYCGNNPVSRKDGEGAWWKYIKKAAKWIENNIIEPVVQFANDIAEDCRNFDINNTSEQKVLDSNYFSIYKGVPVIRTNGSRSGSFGIIFLTRETNTREHPEDMVRHEYGHTQQLKQIGLVNYTFFIAIPSYLDLGEGEYYSKKWEVTADIYGGVESRNHSAESVKNGFNYLATLALFNKLMSHYRNRR